MLPPSENPPWDLALRLLESTGASVFLTGRAGTGKTTFLRNLRTQSPKRMVIVAPTGVAAMNAGGVTIHSLFQLPFGPIVPGVKKEVSRFQKEKIGILRSMDLLVIDEISMVRADVLDGICEVLQRFRDPERPFGGVQLLLIGDLQQLSPVAKPEEWDLLSSHYANPYFFSSRSLQQLSYECVKLQRVYRQSDAHFLDLLNRVREGCLDAATLAALNARYQPDFIQGDTRGYITLTTHNQQAERTNSVCLAELPHPVRSYPAIVEGDFPENLYPTAEPMELKVGAQVMFLRNDSEQRYFNGKIGIVEELLGEEIRVRADGVVVAVERTTWENIQYQINERTQEIESKILGSFQQFPLRLAWAITIHKSQGLTFNKAIIDAKAAFAHGQVYVALSRCRSLEGLVLGSPLQAQAVIQDHKVSRFTGELERRQPSLERLQSLQRMYQEDLLCQLFRCSDYSRLWATLQRIAREQERSLVGMGAMQLAEMHLLVRTEVLEVGERFLRQLGAMVSEGGVEGNEALQDRVRKASAYFLTKSVERRDALLTWRWRSDNKETRKSVAEAMERLAQFWEDKRLRFAHCAAHGFDTRSYLHCRARALLDSAQLRIAAPSKDQGEDLLVRLKAWRSRRAEEWLAQPEEILSTKALDDLLRRPPTSLEALAKIKSIGKRKQAELGEELVALVRKHRLENDLPLS